MSPTFLGQRFALCKWFQNNLSTLVIGKYLGMDRVELIENEEFGYYCLVKATKAVLDKLNIENRTYTQITDSKRIEKRMFDPIALREAVINAIIHNDFSHESPPKFELFSDRIEITSTAKLSVSISQAEFFMGYSSPPNKELMRVFRDLGMVEQMGSGIARILQKYPKSVYHFNDHFIRVILPFAKEFVSSTTPQVTPQAEKILAFCIEPKKRGEIQQYMGLKDREHFRKTFLNPLVEAGLLLRTIPDKPNSSKQQFYTAQHIEK